MKDRERHSNILQIRSFRGADSDTGHSQMVAKVIEILAASKKAALKFVVESFNRRKLNELEIGKECQIEIPNGFAALEKGGHK